MLTRLSMFGRGGEGLRRALGLAAGIAASSPEVAKAQDMVSFEPYESAAVADFGEGAGTEARLKTTESHPELEVTLPTELLRPLAPDVRGEIDAFRTFFESGDMPDKPTERPAMREKQQRWWFGTNETQPTPIEIARGAKAFDFASMPTGFTDMSGAFQFHDNQMHFGAQTSEDSPLLRYDKLGAERAAVDLSLAGYLAYEAPLQHLGAVEGVDTHLQTIAAYRQTQTFVEFLLADAKAHVSKGSQADNEEGSYPYARTLGLELAELSHLAGGEEPGIKLGPDEIRELETRVAAFDAEHGGRLRAQIATLEALQDQLAAAADSGSKRDFSSRMDAILDSMEQDIAARGEAQGLKPAEARKQARALVRP